MLTDTTSSGLDAEEPASPNATAIAVGERLRQARKARNISLAELEAMSDGEFKASAVGAYERGDRALSVARLAGLAELYGVSLVELVPGGEAHAYTVELVGNIGEAHRRAQALATELSSLVGHYAR